MQTTTFVFDADDEEATARLGRALARALPASAVVALHGTLGAGKTRLVQAIAEAAGVDRRDVVSPTFVLVQEHFGMAHGAGVPIYHIDAYRLRDADEFRQLGGEEYLSGPGWVLIEWAERVAQCLPEEMLEITLEVTGESSRRAIIAGHGDAYVATIAKLRM